MTQQLTRSFGMDGTYTAFRNRLLQSRENSLLFLEDRPAARRLHMVSGNPTLGFGYDLATRSRDAATIVRELRGAGISVTAVQEATITDWKAGRISTTQAFDQLRDLQSSRAQAQTLFDLVIGDYESRADIQLRRIPNAVRPDSMAGQLLGPDRNSVERAVLVDLAYQNARFIGPKLQQALAEGNREATWFEIRYGNTTGTSDSSAWLGLDARMSARAEAWGLDLSTPASAQRAAAVFLARQNDVGAYIEALSSRSAARGAELRSEAIVQLRNAGTTLGLAGTFELSDSRFNYVIAAGETLSVLTNRLGLTEPQILAANPTRYGTGVSAGTMLALPNRAEMLAGAVLQARGPLPATAREFQNAVAELIENWRRPLLSFAGAIDPAAVTLLPAGQLIPPDFNGSILFGANGERLLLAEPLAFGARPRQRLVSDAEALFERAPACFLPGTPVLMAGGAERAIERVRAGDLVMAFDPGADRGRGALVPRLVARTFRNTARAVVHLRGLRVTPGHVCLTDGGRFETVAAILLRDGALVQADGTAVRARTGAAIGSSADAPVRVRHADPETGEVAVLTVRAGIPCGPKGETLAKHLASRGVAPLADGRLRAPDGTVLDAAGWPDAAQGPLDTAERRLWAVRGPDGRLFAPDWILAIQHEAEREEDRAAARGTTIVPWPMPPAGAPGALAAALPRIGAAVGAVGLAGHAR